MIALALLLPTVQAAPIEFHYGGVITSADAGTGLTPGTRFDGSFTYDPQTNPQAMGIENAHYYTFGTSMNWPDPPAPDTSAMSLTIGGQAMYSRQGNLNLGLSDVGVNTSNDPNPHTALEIHSYDIDHKLNIELMLSNSSRSVFGSLDIPTAINLTDFPLATISVTGWGATPGTYLHYQGTIDTLSQVNVTATPEPASLAMWLGLAASAWGIRVRMRSRT